MTKFTDVRGCLAEPIDRGSVLEAGGKPSTRFPPEGLVELTCHAKGMQMSSNEFLMEKSKFSKNLKNVIFLKFHQNFVLTFDMS